MPILLEDLREAAARPRPQVLAKSATEALAASQPTAFLSHSHEDEMLAKGLQNFLAEKGWKLYIDWQDTAMPEETNKETAQKIKKKIEQADWFIFLATPHSVTSRWCPWEIGYADRAKEPNRIVVIRTEDEKGNFYGNEYLQLYQDIDKDRGNNWKLWQVNETKGGVLLENVP